MRRILTALSAALLSLVFLTASAKGEFGLEEFDVAFTGPPPPGSTVGALGQPVTQAGAHPFQMVTSLTFDHKLNGGGGVTLDEAVKDLLADQVEGFVGALTAVPKCSDADFLTMVEAHNLPVPACPVASALGVSGVQLASKIGVAGLSYGAIYNLEPPPGVAAKVGFWIFGLPVPIELGVKPGPPYNVTGGIANVSQALEVIASKLVLWGTPADHAHDPLRGNCLNLLTGGSFGECEAGTSDIAFLTLPRACRGPLATAYRTDSWLHPGAFVEGSVLTHDEAGNPQGMTGCGKLGFSPTISTEVTSTSAETGSGLDFNLDFSDEGLGNPDGLAGAETKKAVVALPQGVTINPSVGEGLEVCTPDQLERESASSYPGQGCPEASKVGSLHADLPIVEEPVEGSIFLAQQDDPATTEPGAENPFDSLLAAYFVLKNEKLGVIAKLPVLIEPDPNTGQLLVTLDESPQFPLSHFNAHLRTGARAALVTPGACGTYTTEAKLYPWSNPTVPTTVTSSFKIDSGVGGGPCPPGGVPPFHPHFEAGSINTNAGSFSPFNMRLIRADGEQDKTKFSAGLPPRRARLPGGGLQMPRLGDRCRPVEDRQAGDRQPLLPGKQPDRPHPGRSGSRLCPHLRKGLHLPRRPLPRRPPQRDCGHPCCRRALRRGNGCSPAGTDPEPENRGSGSRRRQLRTDPTHHQGHRLEAARPAGLCGPPELHAEPDQLR